MITPIIQGKIENKQLTISSKTLWQALLNKLNGKLVDITIKKQTNLRSRNQNNFYWGVVIKLIADYTGFTPEETHQIMAKKFLSYQKEYKGREYPFVRSTTKLSTMAFEDYQERIRNWAAGTFNIQIPYPGEAEAENIYE